MYHCNKYSEELISFGGRFVVKSIVKVIVGMSGGVDSSVAAYLLKEQGFDVSGVFFKLFKEGDVQSRCCNLRSAYEAAEIIGIPFETIDVSKEFQTNVFNHFLESYKKGLTPNPCTVCNERIKFGIGFDKGREIFGESLFATGHYAIIERKEGSIHLRKGRDKTKDQSYMLWRLERNLLEKVVLPLGEFTKDRVQEIASSISIVAGEESEDLCFVKGTFTNFIKSLVGEKKGEIVNTEGKVLGEHGGAYLYTIGQRSGLGVSSCEPLYVVGIDANENRVILGSRRECYSNYATLSEVNFIEDYNGEPVALTGKVRYRGEESSCTLKREEGVFVVDFNVPQFAITPGQSLVLYKGDTVFGGGVIMKVRRN